MRRDRWKERASSCFYIFFSSVSFDGSALESGGKDPGIQVGAGKESLDLLGLVSGKECAGLRATK